MELYRDASSRIGDKFDERDRLIASCAHDVFNEYVNLLQYSSESESSTLQAMPPIGVANVNFNAIKTFLSNFQCNPNAKVRLFPRSNVSHYANADVETMETVYSSFDIEGTIQGRIATGTLPSGASG